MAPEETIWDLDPHTAAKHGILSGYLSAWFPIMAKWNSRLVVVDGFAGPGVYTGGEPGSPIIALKTLLDHDYFPNMSGGTEFVFIFIDEDSRRIKRLHKEVDKLGELPNSVKVHIIEGAFQDEFGEVLDQIEKDGGELAPTFAFIDPFGYAQAPMTLSGRFLQFDCCEVLVYVPLTFVRRFVTRDGQANAMTSLFGTDEWKKAGELPKSQRNVFLHDLFAEQLKKECGLTYVRSFEIVSSNNQSSGYTLFFGTTHKLGLARMKESMWRIDRVKGQRYKDTTVVGTQPLFEDEVDLDPLRDAMMAHFGAAPFTIEEAVDFTLTETPYIESHVKKLTLKPLEADDKLEVLSARKRRFTYPDGTRMRFTR
jgi:three-Cys-motif partner protein